MKRKCPMCNRMFNDNFAGELKDGSLICFDCCDEVEEEQDKEKEYLESLTKEALIPLIWKDYFPAGTDTQGEHSMLMIKKWLSMDKTELVALAKKGE